MSVDTPIPGLGVDTSEAAMGGQAVENSASLWAQLPADILTAVLSHLDQTDVWNARKVCRPWAEQVLQDVTHLTRQQSYMNAEAGSFLATRLPNLSSLTLRHTQSLFGLHLVTQLTSITFRMPCYVPDLLPLSVLPNLRTLCLNGAELGRFPCFTQLSQVQDLALLGIQQHNRADFDGLLNTLFKEGCVQNLQVIHALMHGLGFLDHYQASSGLRTLCLSVQFLHDFERVKCLQGLQALALTRAGHLDLSPLLQLSSLQALSLAGLQSLRPQEACLTLFKQLAGLKLLRVLDIRHAGIHINPRDFMSLPHLRLLATDIMFRAPPPSISPRWKLLREVKLTTGQTAPMWELSPAKHKRLENVVLHNANITGRQAAADDTDEAHMRLFDSFWLSHVEHSVFASPEDDTDEYEDDDYDDDEDWGEAHFMDDDEGYGYPDDAFNYMDDDEAWLEGEMQDAEDLGFR